MHADIHLCMSCEAYYKILWMIALASVAIHAYVSRSSVLSIFGGSLLPWFFCMSVIVRGISSAAVYTTHYTDNVPYIHVKGSLLAH
jgi:hypothetical protein